MAEKSKLERYLPLLVAIVGVISAVVGGTVSHFWTRSRMVEERRLERGRILEAQHLEYRNKAYTDFLQGQTLLWRAPEKIEEANQLITSAKLRILLTGSHSVICAMASYWILAHQYQDCEDPEQRKKDAAIYQEMRREFFNSLGIADPPDVDATVLVPYLWPCSLPGINLDRTCKIR